MLDKCSANKDTPQPYFPTSGERQVSVHGPGFFPMPSPAAELESELITTMSCLV